MSNFEINSNKQIKRGAIMSYVAIFFNIAAGLIYTPWMIRQIGQSDYGLYSLSLTIIGFFSIDFGLGEAVSRFLSKYNAENNETQKRDFLGITFKLYMLIDLFILVTFIVVFIFADRIYAELTVEELAKFRIVFLIAALYGVASFPFLPLNGILISNERFVFQKFMDLFNKVITVTTMIVVLLLGYRLYSLVIVNAVSGIITIFVKLLFLFKNGLINANFKSKDKKLMREIFDFSVWTAIIGIAQRFILNITPTVLAAFVGSIQVSLFSIAMTIEGYTWTFANALNGLFLPKVTRMTHGNYDPKEIENLMIKVGRVQLVLVGLLIIGIITMGKEFMILWMGADFLDSYYVAILMITPFIITLTQQIGKTALIAANKIKYLAICAVIVAVISFVLSILLSRYYGAIGSGLAIFIGNIIGQVIGLNVVYYNVLNINVFRFFKECHLKLSTPLLLTTCIGLIMQKYYPLANIYGFMFKVIIICIIYGLLTWGLSLNNYEKSLFLRVINKVFKSIGLNNN